MARSQSTYERWMAAEGVPIVTAHGVTDVNLDLGPWERLGGRGAFIELVGMEGLTGMYVAEIRPGGRLEPERHLYDELIYILSGRGATEVWSGTLKDNDRRSAFEWKAGSFFAPPLNVWHQLYNGSGVDPVRLIAVTSAPLVMDLYHNSEFVFRCDYQFTDRFDGRPDYFNPVEVKAINNRFVWETNFIPDARSPAIFPPLLAGHDHPTLAYQLGNNVLVGHIADWPAGKYDEAHHHGGGAVLLFLQGRGYTLMWPSELGNQPFHDGHADKVERVDWREGSVISPPTGWFHQHFSTGVEPSRELALRYGSVKYGVGFHDSQRRAGLDVSTREGGNRIDYEDEDPEIRRLYEAERAALGVPA